MVLVETKLLGPVELWKEAWNITKSRFWILAACVVIPGILTTLVSLLGIAPFVTAILVSSTMGVVPSLGLGLIVAIVLAIMAMMIIGTWQGIAFVFLIAEAQQKLGLVEAFKKGWPKIWGFWWLMFLEMAIIMGGLFPLVIPGLILAVSFVFGQYVYVLEGVSGLKALRISRAYIRGRAWKLLGRMIFLALPAFVIGMVQAGITAVIGKESETIVGIVVSLLSLPVTITTSAYMYLLYQNAKSTTPAIDMASLDQGKKKWIFLAIWGSVGFWLLPLGIIAGIILTAINPTAQLQKAREMQLQQQRMELPESTPDSDSEVLETVDLGEV